LAAEFRERPDVPASAKCASAHGRNDYPLDGWFVGPSRQLASKAAHHAMRDCVQRLRTIERNDASRSTLLEQNFSSVFHHMQRRFCNEPSPSAGNDAR
jgi:hypothetical protein